jgi:putative flippase GtrA
MRKALHLFLRRDTHPAAQFVKYGMAGAVATAVHVLVFYVLALTLFPALGPEDRLVVWLNRTHAFLVRAAPSLEGAAWLGDWMRVETVVVGESVRSTRFLINQALAFLVSNLTAYLLNIRWVFEPGRHDRHLELALFYIVSAASMVVGAGVGWALIRFFGAGTTMAFLVNVGACVAINFVCRKCLVFKG